MKRFKLVISLILLLLISSSVGLYAWLCNPLDHSAWRINVRLPYVKTLHVRAYALLELVASPIGRKLINHAQWQNHSGQFSVSSNAGVITLSCLNCQLKLNGLAKQPVKFDEVTLTMRRIKHQLSGVLTTRNINKSTRLLYSGTADMQSVDLQWSLPTEPIADLLMPLKPQSETIQKAHVTGTISATGTLHLPNKLWSAKPIIQGFDVTGLGTQKLNASDIHFQCPNPSQSATNSAPHIWLSKVEMGRWLPMATLIAEDAKFKHHNGYDMETLSYLLAQEKPNKALGGSTITQQLAKYLFTGGEHLWKRKIEELLYAVEMESTLGKDRILNLYLNTVDWGPGICGANEAAQAFFAKTPQELSPIQAAWLAGNIRNPHRAWQEQYKTNKPDIARILAITRFMPNRVQQLPIELNFALDNPS
jgi:hypothetical protein